MPEESQAIALEAFDTRRPAVRARLTQRTPGGGFVVPDADLVRAVRAANQAGAKVQRDALFTLLLERSRPMFRKMAHGLAHRPQWMEDAIADMTVQLWREVLDPNETFMLHNFAYYLKCLCTDNFNRLLRAEGHGYRVNERGQVVGRPEHVPAALVESSDRAPDGDEEGEATIASVADPASPHDDRLAALEAQRILLALPDPLDRKIVYLRVFGQMQWAEIAALCGKTERTMRTRFERARERMRAALEDGASGTATARGNTQVAERAQPPGGHAPARGKGDHHHV